MIIMWSLLPPTTERAIYDREGETYFLTHSIEPLNEWMNDSTINYKAMRLMLIHPHYLLMYLCS